MNRSSILILLTILLNIGYAQNMNKVNAEYYLLDEKGNKISASFSHIGEFSNQGYAVFAVGGNSVETVYGKIPGAKYGIIHESGKIIVPASYDYLEVIYSADSVYISSINGLYGLLNENGKTIIEPQYTELSTLYDVDYILNAKGKNGACQLLDYAGKVLTKTYQFITSSTSGFIVQSGGYQGMLDKNFKELIPTIYEDVTELESGIFHITDKYQKQWLMDIDGKKLCDKFDNIEQEFDDNYTAIGYKVTKRGKDGFLDLNYKSIIPPSYLELSKITMGCNDYLFSYSDNNKYGLLDKSGKKLGKAIYSSVNNSSYFGKYILVGMEKKAKKQRKNKSDDLYFDDYSYTPSTYGLVDLTGKMVLKAIYDDYNYSYGETSLIVL